jgi:hypothetical protein
LFSFNEVYLEIYHEQSILEVYVFSC